jgi:hypothetical protein
MRSWLCWLYRLDEVLKVVQTSCHHMSMKILWNQRQETTCGCLLSA